MLKRASTLSALFIAAPLVAFAQQPGINAAEMMKKFQDPAAMQKMAAQAEAASQCMAGIDQAELDGLTKRAKAAGDEIERLCAAGKKAEALVKGISLSREMNANATVQKIRECSKGMSEMMEGMPGLQSPPHQVRGIKDDTEPTDRDICN